MKTGEQFIAIVGMACRFAGSEDLKAYWLRILTGEPAISDYADRSAERYLKEPASSFRNVPTLRAGYLNDLWQVRSADLSMPAAALPGTNPEYYLAADLAAKAVKDAGEGGSSIARERIGVMVGYSPAIDPSSVGWCQHGIVVDQTMELVRRCFPGGTPEEFDALRRSLVAALPEYDSRNTATLFHHTLAKHVAERCMVSGPSFCIDGGEISSLVAIQAACDALRADRVDLALAGGIQGLVTPPFLMAYGQLGLISKSGGVHPFGKDADGSLPGEGGGFIALKRYSDAVKAGDRIYAIVKSCGIASNGDSRRVDGGIAEAVRSAWRAAPADLDTLDLLEANGCGIPAIDRAEIRTMNAIFGAQAPLPPESVALGSVKALIGHCGAAAGIASVIKVALSLYHRILPPSQEAGKVPDSFKLGETPFYLNARPRPWVHNDAGAARRAGVTSLAVGGAAAHVVLEQ